MYWPRPELRVLFVCTANICRSPLAEALLRHHLQDAGLARQVQVGSAGTQAIQRGLRPDPRVAELVAAAGISLGRIRSRRLTLKMLQRNDHVLVMDGSHMEDVARLYAGDTESGGCPAKVELLGRFLPSKPLEYGGFGGVGTSDIPDPYFGDLRSFREVYDLIDLAVWGFLKQIAERYSQTRVL